VERDVTCNCFYSFPVLYRSFSFPSFPYHIVGLGICIRTIASEFFSILSLVVEGILCNTASL
jgi:hypothetical protein